MALVPGPFSQRLYAAVVALAFVAAPAPAQDKPLDAATLKKVKAASVHIRVKLQDGRSASGSGFLTDEPGLVITNAHVLHMLDPDSRKPAQVEVTVHPGTDKSKTLPGTVLGVDRGSDLGAVRIDAKDLPPPIPLGTAADLNETDTVYVFGFPFGTELGKEITVSKSSVSSLRKVGTTLNKVQLNGGLNPGNSGGPVVDAKGRVVGVAVSGVRGTQIGFAIPAEVVGTFLNGRIVGSSVGQAYTEGDKRGIPITLDLIDPLARLKKVEVEIWSGPPGPPRPPGAREPAALPGDGPKVKSVMRHGAGLTVVADVPVPPLGEKQVYWMRPVITNGRGETKWVMATPIAPSLPLERRAAVLAFKPPANARVAAELTSQGGFRLRNEDGEENALVLDFRAVMTQQYGKPDKTGIPVRLQYNQIALDVKIDQKPHPLPAEARKALGDAPLLAADLVLDTDGGLATAKADLSRVPKASQAVLDDLGEQALTSVEVLSVPLPGRKVDPTEKWKARRNLQIGSALISVPAQADLVYEFLGVRTLNKRDFALIEITGTVRGRRGDGVDVGGSVSGIALLSLETGEVLSGKVSVKADVDLRFGNKAAKAIGSLDVRVRPPVPDKK